MKSCQVHRIVHNGGRVDPGEGGWPDMDQRGHRLQGDSLIVHLEIFEYTLQYMSQWIYAQ